MPEHPKRRARSARRIRRTWTRSTAPRGGPTPPGRDLMLRPSWSRSAPPHRWRGGQCSPRCGGRVPLLDGAYRRAGGRRRRPAAASAEVDTAAHLGDRPDVADEVGSSSGVGCPWRAAVRRGVLRPGSRALASRNGKRPSQARCRRRPLFSGGLRRGAAGPDNKPRSPHGFATEFACRHLARRLNCRMPPRAARIYCRVSRGSVEPEPPRPRPPVSPRRRNARPAGSAPDSGPPHRPQRLRRPRSAADRHLNSRSNQPRAPSRARICSSLADLGFAGERGGVELRGRQLRWPRRALLAQGGGVTALDLGAISSNVGELPPPVGAGFSGPVPSRPGWPAGAAGLWAVSLRRARTRRACSPAPAA